MDRERDQVDRFIYVQVRAYIYIYICVRTHIYIYKRTLELLGTNGDQTSWRYVCVCVCARQPCGTIHLRPLEVYVRSRALQVAHDGRTGRLTNHYARAVRILRALAPPRKRYHARKGRRKWSMAALRREAFPRRKDSCSEFEYYW